MANQTLLEKHRQDTRKIIAEVLEDGSDPGALYLIEHHFFTTDADQLEQLALEAFKLGYEVDDPQEGELQDGSLVLCCDVMREGPLQAELIDTQVEQMLVLGEKYQVNYDGWGTWFEDPDAENDEDTDDDSEESEPDNDIRH